MRRAAVTQRKSFLTAVDCLFTSTHEHRNPAIQTMGTQRFLVFLVGAGLFVALSLGSFVYALSVQGELI